jgi:uncharacterized protein (DUF697 family)
MATRAEHEDGIGSAAVAMEKLPDEAPPEAEVTQEMDKSAARSALTIAKKEYEAFGGWTGLKQGEWLFSLIQKSLNSYYQKANADYFRGKYPGLSDQAIIRKLISVAARNAALVGAVTGAIVSTDEIVGIVTLGEAGVGIPANIAIAAAAIGGEILLLTRIQLQLVVNIAKVLGCPLDPDDPEDVLIIFAYAFGGGVAEAAGKMGMKVGGKTTEKMIRKYVSKAFLEALKELGRRVGIKILQRTIIKYAVPLASVAIGTVWNYTTTKSVGKLASRHFRDRMKSA